MCRVITYLGNPIALETLLYKPDNSLVRQSYDPKQMTHIQNLAGFGMSVWNAHLQQSSEPLLYRTTDLPFFDKNLRQLAHQLDAHAFIAHVRGVDYSDNEVISQQNIHPFAFPGASLVMAHNGGLACFSEYRYELIRRMAPSVAQCIKGTTDSECIYGTILSQLEDPFGNPSLEAVEEAVVASFRIIEEVRQEQGVHITSPVNLFMSNGEYLITTRYVFDYGHYPPNFSEAHLRYHSLWYTYGSQYGLHEGEYKMSGADSISSIIMASEPLTEDTTTWVEVMEYSMVSAILEQGKLVIRTNDILINGS